MLYTNDQVNLSQMQTVAERIIKLLPKKRIVLLYGDLGAGKTELVKIIGKKLGIKKSINSPTFLIAKHYNLPNNLPNDVNNYCSNLKDESFSLVDITQNRIYSKNTIRKIRKLNIRTLYHYDLYRLGSFHELVEIGFADVVADKNCITFIEWPDKIRDFNKYLEKYVSKDDILAIHLEHTDNPKIRKINIK